MLVRRERALVAWLYIVIAMVYAMVLVGGLTRLTESGLSMVDWRPIMGALPPLSESEWHRVFEAYRQFPEYQLNNAGMSLAEFKGIFYWEYGHRLLGRLIGVVFFLPFIYFVATGLVRGRLLIKLAFAFLLGGLQGLLGWYMVKSGLVLEPRVSHYRLAAHLSLALAIIGYMYWILLGFKEERGGLVRVSSGRFSTDNLTRSSRLTRLFLGLICFQILYGAMVAGLDAGLVYNSFPTWNGLWIPTGMDQMQPVWLNLLENPVTVQFIHRTGGWLVFVSTLLYAVHLHRSFRRHDLGRMAFVFLALVTAQFVLGVLTLVWMVPVSIASLHQAGAVAILLCAVYTLHVLQVERRASARLVQSVDQNKLAANNAGSELAVGSS